MIIVYATIEDRLHSFLYHSGALTTRDSTKIKLTNNTKELKPILLADSKDMGIGTIRGKINMVKAILKWSSESEGVPDNKYLKALKNQCLSLDTDEFLKVLKKIGDWHEYRNEIIHALMNKNLTSVYLANQLLNLFWIYSFKKAK